MTALDRLIVAELRAAPLRRRELLARVRIASACRYGLLAVNRAILRQADAGRIRRTRRGWSLA